MTISTDIFRNAGIDVATDEQARRSVKAFRALQPTLSAYARILTKNPNVRVEMAARDNGSTDGTKIFFRPPLALGDGTAHVRSLCDKRDELDQQRCPACRVREDVLVTIYHEIAHICFESFEKTTPKAVSEAIEHAVREQGGKYAEAIEKRIKAAPPVFRDTYMGLATCISEFMPILWNALEDARVNRELFKARPGVKPMFQANTSKIFREGVEQKDASGNVITKMWNEYPLNMQVLVGIFCKAEGYDYKGWFAPSVEKALNDAEITKLLMQLHTIRNSAGIYQLSFPVLARLRELGFCKLPDDPEVPEEEQNDQQSDEPSNEEASGDSDGELPEDRNGDPSDNGSGEGDSPSEAGDESGDTSNEVQSESGSGDGSNSEDSSASEGDSDSSSADDSPAEDGAGDADGSEDSESGGDSVAGDPGDGTGEADADAGPDGASDGDDLGSDDGSGPEGDVGDQEGTSRESEGAGSGESNSSPEGSDDAGVSPQAGESSLGSDDSVAEGSAGDSGPQQGDDDSAGESTSETSPRIPAGSASREEGDGSGTDSETVPEDDPSDTESSEESGVSGDLETSSEEVKPSGSDNENPEGGDSSDKSGLGGDSDDTLGTESEPSVEDDDEPIDTGADDGTGGASLTENSELDNLPMGTPEECKLGLLKFGDHEEKPKTAQESSGEEAVDRAIIQGIYFETPSRNIYGVLEHYWGKPQMVEGYNMSQAWDEYGYYSITGRRRVGKDSELHTPESLLGPALLRMRVAFSDNARGEVQKHLKSGKINGAVLGKRANLGDPRLFRKKTMPGKKDYFVLIGMDVSGSTVGVNIALEKAAVMAQATLCDRMGIRFAIYAHSGNLHSPMGGRGNGLDLQVYMVKEPHEVWTDKIKERLEKLGPDSCNLDGHALEYLRKVCDKDSATNKVILYYSDGKMPAENHDEELTILQREIRICKQKGYTLLGVGIRTDSPARHGLDTVQVDSTEDVGKVVRHLEKVLR